MTELLQAVLSSLPDLHCLLAGVIQHKVTLALIQSVQSVSEHMKLGSGAKCTGTIGSIGV